MKLKGKIFITGTIEVKTGLHIGGSKAALNIGEIDNNIIKTAEGVPYIPASSLKGRLRSCLERSMNDFRGNSDGFCTDKNHTIAKIFGIGATRGSSPTRLIVRDAFLSNQANLDEKKAKHKRLSENLTISKHENVISRKTGGTIAGGLREVERIPVGAEFSFSLIYSALYEERDSYEKDIDNLQKLHLAMKLLQDESLGGSGTRGYGQIIFKDLKISYRTVKMYEDDIEAESVTTNFKINESWKDAIKELKEKFKDETDKTTSKRQRR